MFAQILIDKRGMVALKRSYDSMELKVDTSPRTNDIFLQKPAEISKGRWLMCTYYLLTKNKGGPILSSLPQASVE